jgi:predicted amidohydrolase
MSGPSVEFLAESARRLGAVVMGTLLIREDDRVVNRLVSAFPDGRLETYDKRHLFRLSEEYRVFTPGNRQRIVEIKGWKVALTVCYDLRFPVWCRNTWSEGVYGYDLMVCLANWPAARSHVWKTLLAARAIENQACAVGVNRIGMDGDGTAHAGHSMALDAKGRILLASPEGEEHIGRVTLNYEELRSFRETFPVGTDWDPFELKT